MTIKDIWSGTSKWLRSHSPSRSSNYKPDVDDDGLISQEAESTVTAVDDTGRTGQQSDKIVVKAIPPKDKHESLEKLHKGFNKLVEQLQDINEHLGRQVTQHENLMSRMEQLPSLLESFPSVVENQKRITEQLLEQLKSAAAKNQQFIDAVEKIPNETAKQTDSIMQMSRTFATSDRYLKYIVSRQNKRFMWVFIIALGICVAVILILTGIVIYLKY